MRPLIRGMLPAPLLMAAKRLLRRRSVGLVVESVALARAPKAPVGSPELRSVVDVREILDGADPATWERVLERIQQSGLGHNAEGVNPGDRRAISALVAHLQPRRVLEIGTHIGASTVTLAAALAGSPSTITTVDVVDVNDPRRRHWEKFGAPNPPRKIVEGLAPVEFVVSDSASYLAATPDQFDFIFLDGSHEATTVYREVPLALSHLTPDGVILLHDYFPGGQKLWERGEVIVGPYLALRRLIREGWPISVAPLGALPWPTKLGSHLSSLALVVAPARSAVATNTTPICGTMSTGKRNKAVLRALQHSAGRDRGVPTRNTGGP